MLETLSTRAKSGRILTPDQDPLFLAATRDITDPYLQEYAWLEPWRSPAPETEKLKEEKLRGLLEDLELLHRATAVVYVPRKPKPVRTVRFLARLSRRLRVIIGDNFYMLSLLGVAFLVLGVCLGDTFYAILGTFAVVAAALHHFGMR